MTDYSYIAIDKNGQVKRGDISSQNSAQIYRQLEVNGLELISFQETKGKAGIMDLDMSGVIKGIFYQKISPMEKITFAHHLAVMLKAGVPIIESVDILKNETASPKFKKIIDLLRADLEKGKPVSSILEKEKFFSPAHLAMLKAGEASGKVIESLGRIASDLKRDYQLKKKVTSAMAYPAVVTMALVAISGFIIVFVLPKIGDVFKQMNLKIPLPTQILLTLGTFISTNFTLVILIIGVLVAVLIIVNRFTNWGSKFFGKIVFIIPVVKKVIEQINMARFIRSLSSLLSSGVPIAESLNTSGQVFGKPHKKETIKDISNQVKEGVSLTEAFQKYQKEYGGLLVKMVSVGEKSGKLSDILEDLAVFYEGEVEGKLESFSAIVEPVLMLLVGLGVGGMILSIIGPIYQMMGSLSQ
ncbi:hypothetical protein COT75_04075 [Candidatus Beckwithbacteria bacterium CG10_big_fil_rev_8_21_14_0_10_34_10]|uniref:Type II secretion system protein GspF domain-containing protein n=1 Tax=Candidatus Beckwithbacteria bacterium CG10_big_fil_rev_8_21_14_0_10_34_10 TaxID=1974495 RepID=A0A2H0W8M2_9BACT|nr:MAG: hypothetical protein COT75_04075 [Candidatus Beckwithbacteria bacterium CG10_big_fil_rev_8_21_14_0_10_34_10]